VGAPPELDPLLTNVAPAGDAITFAEQMLQLLEEASFSTTYKHALLLALMDACLELADGTGLAPSVLEVTDLAERVIALYWPHVVPYPPTRSAEPLSQSGTGQAEIVTLVRKARAGGKGTARTLAEARSAPTWDRLVDDVAWKLAEMPLPRLQRVGTSKRPFIYDIAWDDRSWSATSSGSSGPTAMISSSSEPRAACCGPAPSGPGSGRRPPSWPTSADFGSTTSDTRRSPCG